MCDIWNSINMFELNSGVLWHIVFLHLRNILTYLLTQVLDQFLHVWCWLHCTHRLNYGMAPTRTRDTRRKISKSLVHYNDVDDRGRTSWHTRPRGTLASTATTPISELALIIGVAEAQLWLWHNGAVPADGRRKRWPDSQQARRLEKNHNSWQWPARLGHRKRLSGDELDLIRSATDYVSTRVRSIKRPPFIF